jgi:hypothetical protein
MSRKIDLTKPLSPEDQFYLQERADYRYDEAKQLAETNGWDWYDPATLRDRVIKSTDSEPQEGEGLGENTGDVNTQKPPTPLGGPENRQTSESPEGEGEGENKPSVNATADPSLSDKDYSEWTNDQLRAEIEKRNEDIDEADEKMSTAGVKSELVDRLREDDANFVEPEGSGEANV